MKKSLLLTVFQISFYLVVTAQKNHAFYLGLDIEPYKNLHGEHELFIEYHLKNM
jgi:hypothetical protein